MSFAQRSVAGEGNACPFDHDDTDVDVDHEALLQFACDTTNLRWAIFRAAFRAEHLSSLPARARALLAALARTVDRERPYAAIFARRELLTGRALQSMRTLYRGLDDLEDAGLIHRPPQRRHGEVGLFGRAYLHLTPKAAALLGLVDAEATERPPTADPAGPATSATATELPSASVADGRIYKDLSPVSFQKRQPGKLPADLERLGSLGFRKFLIFKLMREAGQHGKRLSDVVDVAWEHLREAHAPIAYLRKLLSVPVDFAFERRARQTAADEAQAAVRDVQHVRETIARCAGRTFFDAPAQHRLDIAADASTLTVLDAQEASGRVTVAGWQSDFVAGLRAGKIIAATSELAERFDVARAQAVQGRANVRAAVRGRAGDSTSAGAIRGMGVRDVTPTVRENLARMKSMVAAFAGHAPAGVIT
ncbi:Replication protein O [Paraburkholderia phymatum]|uniref:Replication protein O n=1 Tax=Paraburkholderia phymatum TaxID=148447 RepID=UPI003180C963